MDVFAVQKRDQAGSANGEQAASQNMNDLLIATFSDMLRNSRSQLDVDATSMMARVDKKADVARTEPSDNTDNADRFTRDSAATDVFGTRGRQQDDSDQNPAEKAERPDAPRDTAGRDDAAQAKRDNPADTDSAAYRTEDENQGEYGSTDGAETAADESNAGAQSVDSNANAAAEATARQPDDYTAEVVASQLFTGVDKSTDQAAGKETDLAGLAVTIAKATSGASQQQTANANPQASSGQGVAPGTQQASGNATGNQAMNQMVGETVSETADVKAQQAAALSRAVGDGNKVSVQTGVTSDADVLVSKPTAALSASVVAATENGKSTNAASNPASANIQSGLTQGTEAAAMSIQPDQSNAQAARAQATATAGAAVRGVAQLASGSNGASGQAHTGTGDGFAGTSGQATGQTATAQQSAQAKAAKAPQFSIPRQSFVDQISVQISKAVGAGVDRINIQLRPESLGRVDVRMEVAGDGRVSAVVTADKQETLDMLQRDARELERALQDAGLQADQGSLSFNLKGQNGDGQSETAMAGASGEGTDADDGADDATPITDWQGGIRADGRVDIRA